jgi:hypothetical protein
MHARCNIVFSLINNRVHLQWHSQLKYLDLEVLGQSLGAAEGVDADELELDVLLEQAGQDAGDLRRRRRLRRIIKEVPSRDLIPLFSIFFFISRYKYSAKFKFLF